MTVMTNYNKHQVYGILKNYFWMVNEIQKIDYELSKVEFKGTAQYGMSAAMPTGKGTVGKALENEVIRRSKKSERMYDYSDKVNYLHERIPRISDEKEKVVLDCMLDGMSLTAISHHLKVSRKQVHVMRDSIVDQLVE